MLMLGTAASGESNDSPNRTWAARPHGLRRHRWAEHLTVVVVSSPVPSNPSTATLQAVFRSFSLVDGLPHCRKLVQLDGPQRSLEKKRVRAYKEFGRRVRRLAASEVSFARTHVHMSDRFLFAAHNVAAAVRRVVTDFMLLMQHDFMLARPFDAAGLLRTMRRNATVKHVRLNARPNIERGFDTVLQNWTCAGCVVPLARTCGWSDGPHVTRRDYYVGFVLPQNAKDHHGGKRKFVEESMHYPLLRAGASGGCWALQRAKARGEAPLVWPAHWPQYGSFLYGHATHRDGSYMTHRTLRGDVPQWGLGDHLADPTSDAAHRATR